MIERAGGEKKTGSVGVLEKREAEAREIGSKGKGGEGGGLGDRCHGVGVKRGREFAI